MRQTQTWTTAAALAASAALLAAVGCQSRSAPVAEGEDGAEPAGVTVKARPAANAAPAAPSIVPDWPKDELAGALVLTGQMVGYQEPCGCSEKQKGGLVRRAAFVELLRARGYPLGLLDLGTLVEEPGRERGGPEQTRLKLTTTLKALTRLGYGAVALSPGDLRLGTTEFLMQLVNTLPGTGEGPKFVAANARPEPGIGFEEHVRPSARLEVGPVKVGVTAVLDPAAFEALQDLDKSLLTVVAPEEALPAVLADLEGDTQYQVLMVQGPQELAERLARAYPGFDIVIATSKAPDPPAQPEPLNDGKTQLIQVGKKGMYLGLLGLPREPGGALRYERVELNDRLDRHVQEKAGGMRQLIGDEQQRMFQAAHLLESYPKRPFALFDAPADATFIGAESCKGCHPNTFAKWASTKHAHAYEPLVSDPRQQGRNRENDPSCVACHTTGFEYVGGFVTAEQTPLLKGQQCENCHGPGSKHAAEPTNPDYLKSVARTAEFFERSPDFGCVRCHDEDNDPHFDFAQYWPQVAHKGLDTYDDPGVRRGQPSE